MTGLKIMVVDKYERYYTIYSESVPSGSVIQYFSAKGKIKVKMQVSA
jgi:hypothetical protein